MKTDRKSIMSFANGVLAAVRSSTITSRSLNIMQTKQKKYHVTKKARCEMLNEKEYTCPICGASDRERAYAVWMEQNLTKTLPIRILEIAPAKALQDYIKRNFPMASYKSGDLFMPGVDYQLDVMDMHQIADDSIDFFICSHVLEHVRDDIRAMQEMRRILKPDGKGILVVPIDLNQEAIDEDPDCDDIGERWRRFGQDDHVRSYSKASYMERLASVFHVEEYVRKDFGEPSMYENGLSDTATIYIVSK